MTENSVPGAEDDSTERPIESWQDILVDTDWLDDDEIAAGAGESDLTNADKSALWQRFVVADVAAFALDEINQSFAQPTMDFELQYAAGYQSFAQASARLDQESQRVEAASAEFQPIVYELRAELERQRTALVVYHDEHVDRHRRYREAMVPVRGKMARDSQQAADRQLDDQRRAYDEYSRTQADMHQRRVKAFDDQHQEWLRQHRR